MSFGISNCPQPMLGKNNWCTRQLISLTYCIKICQCFIVVMVIGLWSNCMYVFSGPRDVTRTAALVRMHSVKLIGPFCCVYWRHSSIIDCPATLAKCNATHAAWFRSLLARFTVLLCCWIDCPLHQTLHVFWLHYLLSCWWHEAFARGWFSALCIVVIIPLCGRLMLPKMNALFSPFLQCLLLL